MITLDEAKAYLRVDLPDQQDEMMLDMMIKAAERLIISAVGIGLDPEDERVKQLELMVTADLFENRNANEITSNNLRWIFNDMTTNLRLELRAGGM